MDAAAASRSRGSAPSRVMLSMWTRPRPIGLLWYPTLWDIWYDGPINRLPHGTSPETRDRKGDKISIKLPELRRVAKPDTWIRFWYSGGAAQFA
jgi:hypothetical protein